MNDLNTLLLIVIIALLIAVAFLIVAFMTLVRNNTVAVTSLNVQMSALSSKVDGASSDARYVKESAVRTEPMIGSILMRTGRWSSPND